MAQRGIHFLPETASDFGAVPFAAPDEAAELADLRRGLGAALASLPPMEERVLRMRFGLGVPARRLEEVGTLLGLTGARVWQIEAAARRRLSAVCMDSGLDMHLDPGPVALQGLPRFGPATDALAARLGVEREDLPYLMDEAGVLGTSRGGVAAATERAALAVLDRRIPGSLSERQMLRRTGFAPETLALLIRRGVVRPSAPGNALGLGIRFGRGEPSRLLRSLVAGASPRMRQPIPGEMRLARVAAAVGRPVADIVALVLSAGLRVRSHADGRCASIALRLEDVEHALKLWEVAPDGQVFHRHCSIAANRSAEREAKAAKAAARALARQEAKLARRRAREEMKAAKAAEREAERIARRAASKAAFAAERDAARRWARETAHALRAARREAERASKALMRDLEKAAEARARPKRPAPSAEPPRRAGSRSARLMARGRAAAAVAEARSLSIAEVARWMVAGRDVARNLVRCGHLKAATPGGRKVGELEAAAFSNSYVSIDEIRRDWSSGDRIEEVLLLADVPPAIPSREAGTLFYSRSYVLSLQDAFEGG